MAISKKVELELEHRFDPRTCRHTLNGVTVVLHCHHYASLYSQLADDVGMLDGRRLLAQVAEDSFGSLLADYYAAHGLARVEDRIAIAEQYYAALGLGRMRVMSAGPDSAEVELARSHVDEGWIRKWGHRDKPVNFITSGYVAGMMAAVFGCPPRSFAGTETQSLVSGAARSTFSAVRA